MASDDMLSWLSSTIESDKAAAEANDGEVWSVADARDGDFFIAIEGGGSLGKSCGCCITGTLVEVEAKHIALHDPRDTVARCEAELDILDRVLPEVRRIAVRLAEEFGGIWPEGKLTSSEKMLLKTLASGYRHRLGFNPEWIADLAEREV